MANKLLQGLRAADNKTLTENAALTHESTLNDVLDFYYHAPARRGKDNTALFSNAYAENPVLALRAAFYLRDVRGKGTGERESFKQVLRWLATNKPDVCRSILHLVPEYGRWDDLFVLFGTSVEKDMIKLIHTQLKRDIDCLKESLLS
jgi:hypothetical protein